MNIGFIGNITVDEIHTFDGGVTKSWGGAFYSIATFQNILGENDRLIPITPIGYDIWDDLILDLAPLNKIDTAGLYRSEFPNNKVILRYLNDIEREEKARDILPPINYERLLPIMDTDAILISFFSGFDMELQVLQKLRNNYNGKMLIDIHSLMLGIDNQGIRFNQSLPNWREWTSNFDCVQMNSVEAELLMNGESTYSEIQELAEDIVRNGIEIVNITLGAEGSLVVCKEGNEIKSNYLRPYSNYEAIDPTGCGDAYAAAFTKEYVNGAGAIRSAEIANSVAGAVSTMRGVKGILSSEFNHALEQSG